MARCDYSFYDGGDRCRLMSKLKNQSSDRVNSDHYRISALTAKDIRDVRFMRLIKKKANQHLAAI